MIQILINYNNIVFYFRSVTGHIKLTKILVPTFIDTFSLKCCISRSLPSCLITLHVAYLSSFNLTLMVLFQQYQQRQVILTQMKTSQHLSHRTIRDQPQLITSGNKSRTPSLHFVVHQQEAELSPVFLVPINMFNK